MNLDINELKKSKDLALLLGMFAGDGCLPIKHNGERYRIYPISFYNTNKKYVKLFSDLFTKLFVIKGKIRSRERKNKKILWEFEKYSVELYKMINEDFEIACGKKALNVRMPSFILKGKNILKKNFFLGLLLTDGGIKKTGEIIFHLASKGMLNDLKEIINDLWDFNVQIKEYVQREKFRSYQLTLKRKESSIILQECRRGTTWYCADSDLI